MVCPAIILAGGRGTRLRQLSDHVPKPLQSLGDRRILDCLIQQLKDAGAMSIFITCAYQADVIARYVLRRFTSCHIFPTAAPTPMEALLALEGLLNEDFVVVHGDHWFSSNPFPDLFQRHRTGEMTFLAERPGDSQKSGYDCQCVLDTKSNELHYLNRRKPLPQSDFETVRIVDGCHVLPKEVFNLIRESKPKRSQGISKRDGSMRRLFRFVANQGAPTMRAVWYQGCWENINDIGSISRVQRWFLDKT